MTDREKFELLCTLTTNLVGLQEGSLRDKTRKHNIQIPRMVASVIGRLEKINSEIIADVINRHRTSIIEKYLIKSIIAILILIILKKYLLIQIL